jgi:hypothetical protein
MTYVFLVYGGWAAGFVILFLISWLYYDKRYKRKEDPTSAGKPSNGYLWTAEAFIDPGNGFKYRVYYNPRTGEREYVKED